MTVQDWLLSKLRSASAPDSTESPTKGFAFDVLSFQTWQPLTSISKPHAAPFPGKPGSWEVRVQPPPGQALRRRQSGSLMGGRGATLGPSWVPEARAPAHHRDGQSRARVVRTTPNPAHRALRRARDTELMCFGA